MSQNADIERGFIARVFYRRGGKTMAQTFVEAKQVGATADWFQDPTCNLIWTAAEDLFSKPGFDTASLYRIQKRANELASQSKDEDIKSIKVQQKFFDDSEKLVRGTDALSDYSGMLKDAMIVRKMEEIVVNMKEGFAAGKGVEATVAQTMGNMQSVLKGSSFGSKVSVSSTVDQVVERYRDVYHHRVELGEEDYTVGLPLPWPRLAYTLNGFDKVLTILAARPGVGKTSLAVEMIRYWFDVGVRVVLNSLDMAAVELMKRQLAEISQVSSRKMQFARSTDFQKDITAIEEAGKKLKQLEADGMYTLYTEPDIDILKANVKILKDQGLIDVLVVDYIQLMKTQSRKVRGKKEEVSYVSNQLHAIATELNIPVLALSQINRDSQKEGAKNGTDTEPQLHNIKDSGDIEQDATNVIILHPNRKLKNDWNEDKPPTQFLYHDSNGNYDKDEAKPLMPMWVIVAKARDGDSNTHIPFLNVMNKYSWYQADYEADRAEMFNKVWDNWKHDPIEKRFLANGALIKQEDRKSLEKFNHANKAKVEKQREAEREEAEARQAARMEQLAYHQSTLDVSSLPPMPKDPVSPSDVAVAPAPAAPQPTPPPPPVEDLHDGGNPGDFVPQKAQEPEKPAEPDPQPDQPDNEDHDDWQDVDDDAQEGQDSSSHDDDARDLMESELDGDNGDDEPDEEEESQPNPPPPAQQAAPEQPEEVQKPRPPPSFDDYTGAEGERDDMPF